MSHYVTMEELRRSSQLGDLAVDVEATAALDAAEEAIESYCRRRFWVDTADVGRYYTATYAHVLFIDDLVTLTTLKTDQDGDGTFETTWASGDRHLAPFNAAADGRPYTRIEVSASGSHVFYGIERGVEVTGKFGWPAIPDAVKQATMIQATRFLKRARSAPFGVEAVSIDGTPVRLRAKLDVDVEVMLAPLRKVEP